MIDGVWFKGSARKDTENELARVSGQGRDTRLIFGVFFSYTKTFSVTYDSGSVQE